MMGIYNTMEGMSGKLYKVADKIADNLADRLSISPDVFGDMHDRLKTMTGANVLGGGMIPQLAGAGGGGGVTYVTNLYQEITTPKPLSPSEMTREGQDMLRRSQYQLP